MHNGYKCAPDRCNNRKCEHVVLNGHDGICDVSAQVLKEVHICCDFKLKLRKRSPTRVHVYEREYSILVHVCIHVPFLGVHVHVHCSFALSTYIIPI